MKLLANTLAAAVVMLLAAPWSATAEPGGPPMGQPRPRAGMNAGPPPPRPPERRQEEAAQEESDEEAAGIFRSAPSWYKMLPAAQGEGEKADAGPQSYLPALKDSWEAVSGQMSKLSPEQIKEVALAQMNRLRTVGDDQALKLPAFLQNIMNDPEARKSFAQFALGALGMTAAGVALGDATLLRELSLVALYVAALTQFFRGGVFLAKKVAADAGEEEGTHKKDTPGVRQLLAKMLGARGPENTSGDQRERLEEQE